MRLKVDTGFRIDLNRVDEFHKLGNAIVYRYFKDRGVNRILKEFESAEKAEFVYNEIIKSMNGHSQSELSLSEIEAKWDKQKQPMKLKENMHVSKKSRVDL